MQKFNKFFRKNMIWILVTTFVLLVVLFILPLATAKSTNINKEYTAAEDVARYIKKFNQLPKNYITKDGYNYSVKYDIKLEDQIIGGDTFWNNGELFDFKIATTAPLKECDIALEGYGCHPTKRGETRLVYTVNNKNPRVFFTSDHYKTFTEFTNFSLQKTSNICWIIFAVYLLLLIIFYSILMASEYQRMK